MKGLYARDQFGNRWGPLNEKAPRKSLLHETCRNSARPMYRDYKDGSTKQVGWVVSPPKGEPEYALWCELFTEIIEPYFIEARGGCP